MVTFIQKGKPVVFRAIEERLAEIVLHMARSIENQQKELST